MDAIELHKQNQGKIGTQLKVSLENKIDLSLAYTPGVAQVSQELALHPERSKELSLKGNTIAVISDGSAVLGLGNIGPYGAIPVMEGKAALFKKFGNVDAFPLCVASQDTEDIIRFVMQAAPVFGGINLEDIEAPKCFEIERRLIEALDIPVLHDDQHGTAVVVLAALLNALKVAKKDIHAKILINGAGAAGTAVAHMLLDFGFTDITICDSVGILSKERTDLNREKKELLARTNPDQISGNLQTAIRGKDVFIGVSKGNVVNANDISTMNAKAIVFAMANPIPEIMPEEAKKGGAFVVATGRSDFENQINNVLAFPGIFRGALDHNVRRITTKMLMNAAKNLAELVPNPTQNYIIPSAFDAGVAERVAKAIQE